MNKAIIFMLNMPFIFGWKSTKRISTDIEKNIYQFKVLDIRGNEFDLATLKGKKVMIVNTASKCGLTPQYKSLQKLYDLYKEDNFTIIGFPSNNFLWQEPGSNDKIAEFCEINYGVTFPMMSKINVKGRKVHPLYEFLTQKSKNGVMDSKIKWNFQKYLIDEKGRLAKVILPKQHPLSKGITEWIEGEG